MKIHSIYDSSIVYDTEAKTINDSKIKACWLSDGERKYEDTDSNWNALSNYSIGVTPYRIYETEDGNFYNMNGARWDMLLRWARFKEV